MAATTTATGAAPPRHLSQKEADIQMMLAAEVHLGTKNCDFQMERYVFKRRNDGIYIINLGKTWEKLHMAARVIVGIESPQDIIVQSARPYGQRAVLKFAQYTGANAIAGRHTPGTFTNQMQTSFSEPRLLILTDPRTDHQPIKEGSLGNIPTIAFCDTDSPMRYVDIGIPANNKGKHSIGCLFWLLARMVLQMRGTILPGHKWDVMVGSLPHKNKWTCSSIGSRKKPSKKKRRKQLLQLNTVFQLPTSVCQLVPTTGTRQVMLAGLTWLPNPFLQSQQQTSPQIKVRSAGWDAAVPPPQVASIGVVEASGNWE
ncbi:40S ribosomal protein SA [Linum perenne]